MSIICYICRKEIKSKKEAYRCGEEGHSYDKSCTNLMHQECIVYEFIYWGKPEDEDNPDDCPQYENRACSDVCFMRYKMGIFNDDDLEDIVTIEKGPK